MQPSWRMRFGLAGLIFLSVSSVLFGQTQESDRILSAAELTTLDQENALWRCVRTEEDVATNLKRLRAAKFSAEQVTAIEPRLTALWDVPNERNFGWLPEETVQQIQVLDREFIGRMRAMRLTEATGIHSGGKAPETVATINREWRRAILRALHDDEIAEYQLMNSRSAQEANRLLKDLGLTTDERRTLYGWQREFDGTQSRSAVEGLQGDRNRRWHLEAQLDQWKRIRELLGDERFAIYLGRASPAFDKMQAAVGRSQDTTATTTLDLWWVRQRFALAKEQTIGRETAALLAETRDKAASLLGEARFAGYTQDEDGRWLLPPQRVVRKKS